ncbi:50S ribosomal protein L6 [bacterium]|nr:50S ribosomal protein L6 [bacterium]
MSRIGKKPVIVPSGVKIEMKGNVITVTGPKGKLDQKIHPVMKVTLKEKELLVDRLSDAKLYRAIHGTTRALIANMVKGVTDGFEKILQIRGVGYRASISGKKLILLLGFSHPVEFSFPEGINVTVLPKQNQIVVSGIDKQVVGEISSNIRAFKKPEPYKGKGIRYLNERVRKKAGKAAGVGGSGGKK